eukprot:13627989-Alexandrium_andersonii.AAC.1
MRIGPKRDARPEGGGVAGSSQYRSRKSLHSQIRAFHGLPHVREASVKRKRSTRSSCRVARMAFRGG